MWSWRKSSYDSPLPALSVRGGSLRWMLRQTVVAWMFGIVWATIVMGSRMNLYCRMLGFGNRHFGILSALPFAATSLQFLATILIERTGLRKYQFITCHTLHRALWLVVAAIPLLLPLPSPAAVWLMLAAVGMSWAFMALSGPAWMSWMGDLVPRRLRGRFFAARSVATRGVQLPVVILLAIGIHWATVGDADITAADQPLLLWCLSGLFVIAAICGILDAVLFYRVREVLPPRGDEPRTPAVVLNPRKWPRHSRVRRAYRAFRRLWLLAHFRRLRRTWVYRFDRGAWAVAYQLLFVPLTDRLFRRYVLYGATITFAATVAGPFYYRNLLENLRFGAVGTDMLFLFLGPVVALLASKRLGRLIDAWGRRPVLILCTFLTVLSVTPYFFASRYTHNPAFVVAGLNAIAGGLGWLFGQSGWGEMFTGAPVGAWLILSVSLLFGMTGWMGIMLAQAGIVLGFADGRGRSKYIAASGFFISIGGLVGGLVGGEVARALEHYQTHPIRAWLFEWNNWHAVFLLSFLARLAALCLLRGMPDPGSRKAWDMVRVVTGNVYNGAATRLFWPLRIFGWRVRQQRTAATGRPRRKRPKRRRRDRAA